MRKISVVGIGPGSLEYLIPLAQKTIGEADVIIGYHYYFRFIEKLLRPSQELQGLELSEEESRALLAIEKSREHDNVVVISSGDAGVYAMASLVYEAVAKTGEEVHLETIPGISAFSAAAAKLGAPIGHDFCCISLSDLMTPWETIEKRIIAAAKGEFVTSLYNPRSKNRNWQLIRFKELFLKNRNGNTPVAVVRQVGREEESITITTLENFDTESVDMFSIVMIGNEQSYQYKDFIITPRGYYQRKPVSGEEIQTESFRKIKQLLQREYRDPILETLVIRCIHTTADFDYEHLLHTSSDSLLTLYTLLDKGINIITDVTMVQSGISRHLLERFGNQVVCCLNDPETFEMAERQGITRSQAGVRLAIQKYPGSLMVVGNAPTALFEIALQLEQNPLSVAGVIAAPVGFVNVLESKHKIKTFSQVPMITVEGNKGGSNVAAALVNGLLSLEITTNTLSPDIIAKHQ